MASPRAWERWLLPDRPGLRQFLLAALALLLPLVWLQPVEGTDPRALIASVAIGCGLGLGWSIACGWRWLRAAPLSSLMVLLTCFASLVNLSLVPRWDALVRVRRAKESADFYLQRRTIDGVATAPPTYATGDGEHPFLVDERHGRLACLYTDTPILRWSVRGLVPACYLLVYPDGSDQVLRTQAELEHAVQRQEAATR